MRMRVAITAAAVRTALGEQGAEIWRRVHAGECAVRPVQGFDARGFDDARAAQIWTEPAVPEDDPALRILGPHGRLLDAVAIEAHDAADLAALPREEVGLFVAMGMVDAPVEDLAPAALASRADGDALSLQAFFAGGYRQIHPLWPLSMLNNVAAGQLAIDLDLRGENVVLASDAPAGVRALLEAAWSVQEGRSRAALAAGVSGRISPATLARRALAGETTPPGEGGAALVLEREEDARARGARILGYVCGGATAHGAPPDRDPVRTALKRAIMRAGDPGALCASDLNRDGRSLGDLGPAAAAVETAVQVHAWGPPPPGDPEPRRAYVSLRGPSGGGCLVLEEER